MSNIRTYPISTEEFMDRIKKGVDEGIYTQDEGDEMTSFALRDELTGLGGKRLLEENVKNGLRDLHKIRASKGFSLIYIDLDKFKPLNDKYGHEAGDYALKQFAKVLKKACRRESDNYVKIHRPHGDEFVITLQDTDEEGVKKVISRIYGEFEKRKNAFIRYMGKEECNNIAGIEACKEDVKNLSFTDGHVTKKEDALVDVSEVIRGADRKMLAQKAGR